MSTSAYKTISVNMYRPYDDYRDIKGECITIAKITPAQLARLLTALEATDIPQNACIAHMTLDVSALHILHRNPKQSSGFKYRVHLEKLSGRGKNSPCACPQNLSGRTKMTPLEKCATNIENGECKCPFMAGVIGRIILPNLYNKQKTK